MDKVDKFNKFEKIFFRIHIGILTLGIILMSMFLIAEDFIDNIARSFISLVYTLFYVVIINFIISLIRLVKYFILLKNNDKVITIRRTVVVILTSPIAFFIYFMLMFIMSLTLSSCSFS